MAYRVEFPPDIEKHPEVSSGLSLPKNTGKSGKDGKDNQPIDATEGRSIAVLIDSPIVGPVWFALDDSWKSGDDIPVFYASEIPHLQKMSGEELRKRYEQKLALGGGWIRDRSEDPVRQLKIGYMEEEKMKKPTDYRSDEYPMQARLSADSEGLGAWGNKNAGTVGYVSEVNGSEACEVPEFVSTKHELIQIAKYWFLRHLDNDFYFFVHGQTGSSEWRTNLYAERRIDRIAEIMPEQELNRAIEEVEHAFKQDHEISDEDWDIFKNGTQEQWKSFQDKLWREFESQT